MKKTILLIITALFVSACDDITPKSARDETSQPTVSLDYVPQKNDEEINAPELILNPNPSSNQGMPAIGSDFEVVFLPIPTNPTVPAETPITTLPINLPATPVNEVEISPLIVGPLADINIDATGELTIPNVLFPIISGGISPYSIANNIPQQGLPEGDFNVIWHIVDAKGQAISTTQLLSILSMCDANTRYFSKSIWPILNNNCFACHNQGGSQTPFNLVTDINPDYVMENFTMFEAISRKTDIAGQSLLLVKPANLNNDHGGGNIFQAFSYEHLQISNMVDRLEVCAPPKPIVKLDPIVLLDYASTLRKASLQLIGRVPTEHEINVINLAATEEEKQQVFLKTIDGMLTEKRFLENIKTIFNDKILTNAYNIGTRGLGLRLNTFDNKKYFDNSTLETQGYDKTDRNAIRRNASAGIATSALALISYTVDNNLPFTNILTANYVMVNPYSATVFSADLGNNSDFAFVYGNAVADKDPTQFIPVTLVDNKSRVIPHAGVLTTLPFLARFPSTATNLNRKRSATIFKLFLDTDIEGLASRSSLDLDNVIGQFPTLEDPQCKACHDVMDPVAGLFKNWGNTGEYIGDFSRWGNTKTPAQILAPGYSIAAVDELPIENSAKSLSWLAQNIAGDSRFALSISKLMFEAISGQLGLNDSVLFESLKNGFIASNYNMKTLIKSILLTEQFRIDLVLDTNNVINLNDLGSAHLLTPEQLSSKITSLTGGYAWKSPSNRSLTDLNTYNILYGGIDSQNVITRTTKTTGIMAAVQERIAFQTSCETTPLDFSKPISERAYFKFVEITDLPKDTVGQANIKKNIQYLFGHILNEQQALDSLEVTEAYNLFSIVSADVNNNAIPSKCRSGLATSDPIIVDENNTVRAWMAVLSYLFLDYKFLYQ